MRIAVLSGKGGTGKTFVSVNLAAASKNAVYIDCDVEEPNGRLFFQPGTVTTEPVYSLIPAFDDSHCIGCRKCVELCGFNALVYVRKKPMVFPEVCHSCGGCSLVCPTGAVVENRHAIGVVESGFSSGVHVITGIMNPGEVSAVPVIKAALKADCTGEDFIVIDCPPGSGCSVMEGVMDSDYCILVVEPTAFGFYNFKMVYELVRIMGKPCGIVINKSDEPYSPLESFCMQSKIPVLLRIPYSKELAQLVACGKIAVYHNTELADAFTILLNSVQTEVTI